MKKVNFSEANEIVGGTCKTCTVEYVATGTTACNVVTTCTDKHGKVVSQDSTPAGSLADCGIVVVP
ncbi:uncharacterized protein DUF4762 [Serratia fonticola]|uniref:Uncharacterized protein DUF4762 n=1 Tax=Serratia fonticola TaxID=47917 RepID=A0A542CYU4_SERFO|nr:DUF4762 family protein [Serratia fonticola]TQI82001.1 uncharacterized protein DUF4762 [Serratia fonticola]TQI95976.1 uncharacterized protein DUF4762 [Serratia fonticola]TVZ70473.1 uncharacterized protein DUF4762 [Serratia fonticola]